MVMAKCLMMLFIQYERVSITALVQLTSMQCKYSFCTFSAGSCASLPGLWQCTLGHLVLMLALQKQGRYLYPQITKISMSCVGLQAQSYAVQKLVPLSFSKPD